MITLKKVTLKKVIVIDYVMKEKDTYGIQIIMSSVFTLSWIFFLVRFSYLKREVAIRHGVSSFVKRLCDLYTYYLPKI